MSNREVKSSSFDEFESEEDSVPVSEVQIPWYKVTICAMYIFGQAQMDSYLTYQTIFQANVRFARKVYLDVELQSQTFPDTL